MLAVIGPSHGSNHHGSCLMWTLRDASCHWSFTWQSSSSSFMFDVDTTGMLAVIGPSHGSNHHGSCLMWTLQDASCHWSFTWQSSSSFMFDVDTTGC